MRHASLAIVCPIAMLFVSTSGSADTVEGPSEVLYGDPSPVSIADGGYGVEWETDARGQAIGSVRVTSPPRAAEQWLTVEVTGQNVSQQLQLGPYDASGAVFSVPIELGPEANDRGLVHVVVRLDVLDTSTEERVANRRSRPAYVLNGGTANAVWLSESEAESRAIRPTLGITAEETVDAIVGFEVSP